MRVLVAGAAGAIGRHLIPALIAEGHEVTGTTRSPGNAGKIRSLGATPVIADGLDRQAMLKAVAAEQAGAKRFIAQSYPNWPNERTGGPVKTEDDPLDPAPPRNARQSMAAIRHLESVVMAHGGLVLRYGGFYGHGASGDLLGPVRKRQLPIVGGGTGLWSFCEVTDAAAATVAEWLPYLPGLLGAKPPRYKV